MRKIDSSKLLRFLLIPAGLFLLYSLGIYWSSLFQVQEDKNFEAFTSAMFREEIAGNTLNLHYTLDDPSQYGITSYTVNLGSGDTKTLQESNAALENYRVALSAFTPSKLSEENQLTYDILSDYFSTQEEGKDFGLYAEPLGPTIGTQAQLPVLLAEYAFRKQTDINDYLTLLSQLGTYYDSIMEFEKAKSQAGLFMSDDNANSIINQCQSFITNPESNFLLETFNDKVDAFTGLSDAEILSFKEKNAQIVSEVVIPAYQKLIDGITALKGTGKNPYGLCYLPSGKTYYEYLVKETTGSDSSVEEIQNRIVSQLKSDYTALQELLTQNPSLMSASQNLSSDSPGEMLLDLQKKITQDFPMAPLVSYDVKYVHSSLEDYLSPAFYLSPPIDNIQDNVIYINNASSYTPLELYTTLAHEGYPGHLYQTVSSAAGSENPVRSLFNFGGYVEGWATYVEMYAYSYADVDSQISELYRLNRSIMLGLSSLMDIAIHYSGYTEENVAQYLSRLGFSDSNTAHNFYSIIIEAPANYLKYYVGYLNFQDLRDEIKEDLGDKFDLKDFHQQILSIGPASFPVLEKYVREYYQL